MFEVIILSIIQGITEFLPVSSSAHLILVSKYFNFNNENLILDVSLHLGSLLAIIFYFKDELFNFVNNKKLLSSVVGSVLLLLSNISSLESGLSVPIPTLPAKYPLFKKFNAIYYIGLD